MQSNRPGFKCVERLIDGKLMTVTLCPPRAAEGAFDSRLDGFEVRNPILGGFTADQFLSLAERQGPCPDDYEVTMPYLDMLPDESEGEGASPLHFSRTWTDGMPIAKDFDASVIASVLDANIRRRAREHAAAA